LFAQRHNKNIRIDYNNGFLTISANDAYLKNVLFKLAKESNFFIEVPVSLNKKITINKKEISLRDALRKLLRGLNHAIVYSVSSKKQATISEVYVYEKSRYVSAAQRRIANRIKSYERQIESLKNKLSEIDENSRRGKGYLRRIERIENKIKSLKNG
jgi:hypothetical protein